MNLKSDPFSRRFVRGRRCARGGRGVVALESTIITHGMPYPANAETALAVEADVRAECATPATIAIMAGKLKIGLTADEIDRLAKDRNVIKASRRDVAALLASGESGGTTVASTMLIAARAGLPIFATGGIGGVHRGRKRVSTFPPISRNWGELRSRSSAPARNPFSTFPKTLEALRRGRPGLGLWHGRVAGLFSRIAPACRSTAASMRLRTSPGR